MWVLFYCVLGIAKIFLIRKNKVDTSSLMLNIAICVLIVIMFMSCLKPEFVQVRYGISKKKQAHGMYRSLNKFEWFHF